MNSKLSKCIRGEALNGNMNIGGYPLQEVISTMRAPTAVDGDLENTGNIHIPDRHDGLVIPLGLYFNTQLQGVPNRSNIKTKIIEKIDVISDELFDIFVDNVSPKKAKKNTQKMKLKMKPRNTKKKS